MGIRIQIGGLKIGGRGAGSWTPQWTARLINTALAKLYGYDAGSQKDSFLDDLYKDSSSGVSFVVNKPTKYASNPIFGSDAYTWDRDMDYASVITHADFLAASKYRMWYDSVADPAIDLTSEFICYAYSPDGLIWTKDNTGRYTFDGSTNNNIQFNNYAGAASVIYQPDASADMRYLMSVGIWEYTGVINACARVYKAANPNGPWTLIKTLADNDANVLALGFVKYLDGTYGVYYQDYHASIRQIGLFTSDTTDPTGAWTDRGVIIASTNLVGGFYIDEKYSNNVWESNGLYYSMVTEFDAAANTTKITLYVSRDGITWTSKDAAWIPVGAGAAWDSKMVYEDSGERIRVGNEWWIWYSGSPELHSSSAPFDLKIGLGKIGYKRIGSVEGAGTFVTTAFTPTSHLKLNANVTAGILKVELLKASDDSVITGFSKDEMDNFLTDEYEKTVKWKGHNIPTNQSLKIKFYLTAAYSPVIANATPTKVDITFDRTMDDTSIPDISAFTLAGKTITNVAISGSVVTLTVSVAYVYGDTVTVSYTKPLTNYLKSTSGFIVDSFSGIAVTNNITPPYTKLLLHLDNNVTDSSAIPKTVTNVGVTFANSSPKFSYYGIFDGATSYLTVPDDDDWNFGAGDFTVECWLKRNAQPQYENLITRGRGNSMTTMSIQWGFEDNKIAGYAAYNGNNYKVVLSTGTITDTNWHHVALVRNGINLTIFIDGQIDGTINTMGTFALNDVAYELVIGAVLVTSTYQYPFSGNIDEVRVSKGIARWTANFTPPVAPY